MLRLICAILLGSMTQAVGSTHVSQNFSRRFIDCLVKWKWFAQSRTIT